MFHLKSQKRQICDWLSMRLRRINQIRPKIIAKDGTKISSISFYRAMKNPICYGKIFIKVYKDKEACIVDAIQKSLILESLFNRPTDITKSFNNICLR